MMPTIIEAEKILEEAEQCNLGSWENHIVSRHTVLKKTAELCEEILKKFL